MVDYISDYCRLFSHLGVDFDEKQNNSKSEQKKDEAPPAMYAPLPAV
jgi:hypothetical protein